ncbi:MAG TPA: hypothetical protein VN740_02410 [Solirubrobacteraceae bacterium]|nr:hypothetical protein [Solirubrobacteraceae bacterium]
MSELARTRITPAPTELEAAAIAAALERFRQETAPPPRPATAAKSGWLRAARREAVARDPHAPANL